MHARAVAVLVLLCAASSLPLCAAQATPVVLVADAAGDHNPTSGPLVTTPPALDNVDILQVSASQPTAGTLELAVTTKAPASASENVTLNFTVRRGATSLPNSTATATGTAFSVLYHDGAVSGLPGATAAVDTNDLRFTIPMSLIGAVGGDVLANVSVAADDFNAGAAPSPVTQDDSRAADQAPDAGGASLAYTFPRPAVAGNFALTVQGGSLQPAAGAAAVPFAGDKATVRDRNATVSFRLGVTNSGVDADTVTFDVTPPAQTRVSLSPARLDLAPRQSATATLLVAFEDPANGTYVFNVRATSAHGGQGEAVLRVSVEVPGPPPAEREPVPAGLGFLTPLVTSIGLDKVFGTFAEMAFLLFLVLLAIVIVYLLLFTVKTPWVRVRVTPRRVIVAPGGVAEFHVELEGRKRRPTLARATLRTEGPWTSGLQVGRSAALPGESMDIPLESGAGALPQEAVLRVQVPYDAPARDKQELEFDVVPVDAEGGTYPKHATRARITVEAAPPAVGKYASAHDIRLAEVKHDPPDPRPGATVRTTATIHNDGSTRALLRVVLQKEGKGVAEERVDVPPHDSRAVTMPWTAGAGRNLVKVQIFLA